MFIPTDNLDPKRLDAIDSFNEVLLQLLPKDYINFLSKYGTGVYCDDIIISCPDEVNIPSTFGDCIEFWESNELYTEEDLLHSIQIGWTIDGDIICVTTQRDGMIFVLPRHSEIIKSFTLFFEAIEFLLPQKNIKYFDPDYDGKIEQITLIKNSKLVDILPIHKAFLEKFAYDLAVNEDLQPKYFIKNIGGYVYFDLIYKSSINVKFQKSYANKAELILDFLKKYVE